MQKYGLTLPDNRIGWYDTRQMDALRSRQDTSFLRDILHDALKDCTAVICYNDEIAYWLIKELNRAGYHLPEDMAVTAFDNTYLSNRGIVSITTLSHEPHEISSLAAESAIKIAKGLPVISKEIPFRLNVKQSTYQSF